MEMHQLKFEMYLCMFVYELVCCSCSWLKSRQRSFEVQRNPFHQSPSVVCFHCENQNAAATALKRMSTHLGANWKVEALVEALKEGNPKNSKGSFRLSWTLWMSRPASLGFRVENHPQNCEKSEGKKQSYSHHNIKYDESEQLSAANVFWTVAQAIWKHVGINDRTISGSFDRNSPSPFSLATQH